MSSEEGVNIIKTEMLKIFKSIRRQLKIDLPKKTTTSHKSRDKEHPMKLFLK